MFHENKRKKTSLLAHNSNNIQVLFPEMIIIFGHEDEVIYVNFLLCHTNIKKMCTQKSIFNKINFNVLSRAFLSKNSMS